MGSRHRAWRWSGVLLGIASCGRVGFSAMPGDDASGDAMRTDAPSDGGKAAFPFTVAVQLTTGSGASAIAEIPLGASGFGSACAPIPWSTPATYLLGHPSLPNVFYGIEFDLLTHNLTCDSVGSTMAGAAGVSSAISQPRISFDLASGELFFTTAGSNSLYRASVDAQGRATVQDGIDMVAPGPVVVDPAGGVAAMISPGAPGTVYAYSIGSGDEFGSNISSSGSNGCNVPHDLVVSGSYLVELCHQAVIRHLLASNGAIGAGELMTNTSVDYSAALGGGRYVIANDTPAVQVLELDDGMPTFEPGVASAPTLVALAATPDGTLAVGATAAPGGVGVSHLVEWQIVDVGLVQVGTVELPALASAVAIMNAP
jgi:hypothetical protein